MENKPKTLFKLEIKEAENDSIARRVFINGQEVEYVEQYTVSQTEAVDVVKTNIEIVTSRFHTCADAACGWFCFKSTEEVP